MAALALLVGDPEGELRVRPEPYRPALLRPGLGGVRIDSRVGVGAGVVMLSGVHAETRPGTPITDAPLRYGAIEVGDGCDLGLGAVLLPGTRLGAGIQVGAPAPSCEASFRPAR